MGGGEVVGPVVGLPVGGRDLCQDIQQVVGAGRGQCADLIGLGLPQQCCGQRLLIGCRQPAIAQIGDKLLGGFRARTRIRRPQCRDRGHIGRNLTGQNLWPIGVRLDYHLTLPQPA